MSGGQEAAHGRWTASKLIALGVLAVDASSTYIVLYLCRLSIGLQFSGSLPYLTTLIGALQAATGYVLGHYFQKSRAENTRGGIVYDSALGAPPAGRRGTAASEADVSDL